MALKSTVNLLISAEQTSPQDLGTPTLDFAKKYLQSFADGAGNDQVNKWFSDSRNLLASATENLDLSGVLSDAFGVIVAFTAVKILAVFAKEANVNDVILGGAAATTWVGPFGAATHTIAVRPGGVQFFCAPNTGWPVGAGATDLLKVLNGGGTTAVDYDIVIGGI